MTFKAVHVLFLHVVSGWAGRRVLGRTKACLGCVSETLKCKMLILVRDIGLGV